MVMIEDRFADAETLACPWPYLELLREQQPVFFSPGIDAFVVTRYADIAEVVRNPEIYANGPQPSSSMILWNFAQEFHSIYHGLGTPPPVPTLVSVDGEEHKRQRSALEPFFTVGAVRGYEDKIRRVANELIDPLVGAGEVDLYAEFCLKLPLFVLCELLGIPREAAHVLQEGADANVRLFGGALETPETRRQLARAQAELHLLFQPYIDRYRAQPEDNLISKMIACEPIDGRPFSDQELLSMLTILNVGGNETTTNGLGNSFYLCFSEGGMQERLRAEPQELSRFVEESLRLQPPVSIMPRWTTADTVLNGVAIPEGACVQLAFVSADRDEAQFGCPGKLDTARKGIRNHLSFGLGKHYCLGAHLARAEVRIGLECVLDRLPNIRLDDRKMADVHWQRKLPVRALSALPILFDAK